MTAASGVRLQVFSKAGRLGAEVEEEIERVLRDKAYCRREILTVLDIRLFPASNIVWK